MTVLHNDRESRLLELRLANLVDRLNSLVEMSEQTRVGINRALQLLRQNLDTEEAETAVEESKHMMDIAFSELNESWMNYKFRSAKVIHDFDCYFCSRCHKYIYDEYLGEPKRGIPPKTTIEALSQFWRCPICGAGKESLLASELIQS